MLASGRGSNVIAVLNKISRGELQARVCLVLSDQPDAPVLAKAAQAGAPVACVPRRDYPSRAAFEQALARQLEQAAPALIVLAGFMRVLSAPFVSRFRNRMINLHPSLLPKFPGLNTHQRALDAGDKQHGATVHWVTEVLDGGPVISQKTVPVLPNDTAASLALRVQQAEHQLLPEVIASILRQQAQYPLSPEAVAADWHGGLSKPFHPPAHLVAEPSPNRKH